MSEAKESFIDLRIRGRFEVYAETQEEATEIVRRRIMDEILIKHPSFEHTGLPPLWEEWLDKQTGTFLGVEVREEDEDISEEIEVSWTNIKGGKLYKDGPMSQGVDRHRKRSQTKL